MRLYPATNCFWIVTAEIETEYREVLARPKFKVPNAIQQSWRALIEEVTICVEPSTHPTFLRDPKDEIIIAAALASDADYLVTGDKDLLDEQPLVSTRILRPADVPPSYERILDLGANS